MFVRYRAGTSVIAALLWLLVPRVGSAHTAWPTHYSHKVVAHVEGDRLTLDFTVEIPVYELILQFNAFYSDLDLVAEIEKGRIEELEERFRRAQLDTLIGHLELEVDGEAMVDALQPVDTPINGRATEGFFVYLWELRQPVDLPLDARTEIVVRNALFEGKDAVFANLVDLRGPLELLEVSTPQPAPDAELELGSPTEIATWSTDETRRRLRVVFGPSEP